MTEKTRQILIIVLGLLLIGIALGIIIFFILKKVSPLTFGPTGGQITPTSTVFPGTGGRTPVGPGGTATGTGGLPTAGEIPKGGPAYYQGKPVEMISSDYAKNASIDNSGGLRYYNASDGKYYKIDANGNVVALSDKIFYNVQNTTWGKTKDIAVVEYPDGAKTVYDFDKEKQTTLPKHWEEFSFSPSSDQIAGKSLGLNQDNNWLVTVNNDGTNTKLVESMGLNSDKVTVNWSPSGQTAALSRTGDEVAANQEEVLLIGLNGENLKSIIVEGYGFREKWSPGGSQLLFSVYSDRSNYKPELWIVDAYGGQIGNNRRLLNLYTWANKCTFADENTIYCAVPQTMPTGAGMSPDIIADVSDDVYKIDLKTNIKTKINVDGNYTINNLSYDSKNNKLLFTDSTKSGIYKINL